MAVWQIPAPNFTFSGNDGRGLAWPIDRKHEDAVRRAVGEKKYQDLSRRYPNYTNATRQRLIAADPEMPVPEEFAEILQWLVPDPQKKKTMKNE